jgi:hypothetical protein
MTGEGLSAHDKERQMDSAELIRRSKLTVYKHVFGRRMTVDWADGLYDEANLNEEVWRAITPIALPDVFCDPTRLIIKRLEGSTHGRSVPVCAQSLSLWRLAAIVRHLDVCEAARIARAWMRLPLDERAWHRYEKSSPRIIHAQLLALSEGSTPVLSADIHALLPRVVKASFSPYNHVWPRLCWVYGTTRLGTTCMAYTTEDIQGFAACLAISNCPVHYRAATGERSTEWFAIQDLLEYLSESRIVRHDKGRFSGHDFMDLASYLYDLQKRADNGTSR